MDKVESKGQNQKKDGGKQSDKAPNPTGKKESKPENVKTGQKGDKPPLSQKNDTQTPRVPSTNQRRSNQTDKSQSILSSQPNRVGFFDHLPQKFSNTTSDTFESDDSIHPAIIKLGGLYKVGIIYDDDDRACALLMAFCNVIQDYTTPPKKSLSWELDRHIKAQVITKINLLFE
jgi:translation initiation factor eIF-2B subunit delta